MLRPMQIEPIPPETTRVTHAVIPKGYWYLRVADELKMLFTDDAFWAFFPTHSQSVRPPWWLALITVLQFAERLRTAVNRRPFVRQMNHGRIPQSRPIRAYSRRNPGDLPCRATFRRIVGLINLSCAITILSWTLFSQDIMAGAFDLNRPPIAQDCITKDGKLGKRLVPGPCVALPSPLCGIARPKYLILNVIYLPPGKTGAAEGSTIKYSQSSTTGTTLSVSDSFKSEYKISYSASASFSIPPLGKLDSGSGISYSISRNRKDTSKADFRKTISITDEFPGVALDGVHYDEDRIYLLMNPRIDLCISGKEIQWTLNTVDEPRDLLYLLVEQLKDPTKIPPKVAEHLTQLTSDDFKQILLKAHPLAAGSTVDPNRYDYIDTWPYIPGGKAKETYKPEWQNTKTTCRSKEVVYTTGLNLSGSGELLSAIKNSLKVEGSWTTTDSFETCSSSSTTQSAEVKLVEPSLAYTGPIEVAVYFDVIHQKFAFVPLAAGGRVVVAGTVRDEAGRAAPGREVLLYANGIKSRTFTDSLGHYQFSGDFIAPMEVQVRGAAKQPVPPVDGTAIVDLVRPNQIPRPLRFGPWVPQPPSGIDLAPAQYQCHTPLPYQLLVTVGNHGNTDAPASTTKVEFTTGVSYLLSTPPIAAGETVDLPPVDIPTECFENSGFTCGFTITADSENQLNEVNKENNSAPGECIVIP